MKTEYDFFMEELLNTVKKINKETMEIIKEYSSIKEACLDTGILQGSISNVLRGKCKTAGGYIWL